MWWHHLQGLNERSCLCVHIFVSKWSHTHQEVSLCVHINCSVCMGVFVYDSCITRKHIVSHPVSETPAKLLFLCSLIKTLCRSISPVFPSALMPTDRKPSFTPIAPWSRPLSTYTYCYSEEWATHTALYMTQEKLQHWDMKRGHLLVWSWTLNKSICYRSKVWGQYVF